MKRKNDELKSTFFGITEGFSPGIIDRLLPTDENTTKKSPPHIQDENIRKAEEKRERRRQKRIKDHKK